LQVFEVKDWEALMLRSILPKLAWALTDALIINPSDQDLTAWSWVTAWSPVMPVQLMVNLIEAHFFPKWHDVLRAWLMHNPNYMEVEQWYLNWKVCHSTRPCLASEPFAQKIKDEGYLQSSVPTRLDCIVFLIGSQFYWASCGSPFGFWQTCHSQDLLSIIEFSMHRSTPVAAKLVRLRISWI
jgi:hypothetical protein